MDENRDWHRWFGLSLKDFFHGTPVEVLVEVDLSLKQQWLDIAVIRKEGPLNLTLPDGFEPLAAHNLISFKSFQEPLDDWALEELLGHYVNYRKQVSTTMQRLLPVTAFRLLAVCVRFPQGLASSFGLVERSPGVYDIRRYGPAPIRVIVVNRLPEAEQNALLHLFSADQRRMEYGATHYQRRSDEITTVFRQLLNRYREEKIEMSYTMEQFLRENMPDILSKLPPEERLSGLSVEDRLSGLPGEKILEALSEEQLAVILSNAARRTSEKDGTGSPGST